MPAGRVLIHAVALAGLAAVAIAFGRWLRAPAVDSSFVLLLALAATCALALRRLYGPGGIGRPAGEPVEQAPRRRPAPAVPHDAPLWAPGAVDLNRAGAAELQSLPGVGPVLAARIEAARPFASVDDLSAVPGFTPARVRAIADRVRV